MPYTILESGARWHHTHARTPETKTKIFSLSFSCIKEEEEKNRKDQEKKGIVKLLRILLLFVLEFTQNASNVRPKPKQE